MADPRAFISFDFDHNEDEKRYFAGQAKNSRTPFNIADWSSKEALAQSKWEEIIKDKINRCHLVIVLVGNYMASASGVAKEIKMAKEQDVPIFGVYVGGATNSSNLPEGLARGRVVDWEWDKIASAIDQVMKEGKNNSVKRFF
ncbi:MAG: TIR domain-containing protein [Ktedonobacteraceae bacterium]